MTVSEASIKHGPEADFSIVVLPGKEEAEDVLKFLQEIIDRYGHVSIGEFYDLVGFVSNFADEQWGWSNLSQVAIDQDDKGYVISLPRPQPLE